MKTATCKCGGNIVEEKCFTDGFLVEGMKCNKCGELFFTPDQVKALVKLKDANEKIQGTRKIVKVGSSIAALLPKKVETLGIREGVVESVRVLSSSSLEIKFSKNIV